MYIIWLDCTSEYNKKVHIRSTQCWKLIGLIRSDADLIRIVFTSVEDTYTGCRKVADYEWILVYLRKQIYLDFYFGNNLLCIVNCLFLFEV